MAKYYYDAKTGKVKFKKPKYKQIICDKCNGKKYLKEQYMSHDGKRSKLCDKCFGLGHILN